MTTRVLLSAAEVAARLGVSRVTVYRLIRAGGLPAIRLGDRPDATVRFDPADVEEWLDAHSTRGAA